MSENPCKSFFKQHKDNQSIVKELQNIGDRYDWEQLSASDHSPGVVTSDEALCRLTFNPVHIDIDTKSLKPTAFDDASNKGLSVDRQTYRTIEESLAVGRLRAEAHNQSRQGSSSRYLWGYISIVSNLIRTIEYEGEKALGIYDTAMLDNPAHADICILIGGKQAFRSIRSRLVDFAQGNLKFVE